jgi:hypothetical protein
MDRNPAGYLHYLKVFRFPHEYRIKQNKIKKIAGLINGWENPDESFGGASG